MNENNEVLRMSPHPDQSDRDFRFAFLSRPVFCFGFLILGGVLTALTLIVTYLPFLEWISLIPSFVVFLLLFSKERPGLRQCYAYGFFFSLSYYTVVFHWFAAMSSLEFTGLSDAATVAVMLAGTLGLSAFQAAISAFAFVVVGISAGNRFVRRCPFLLPFLIAASWTVFEWVQTIGWWGVPWGRLSLGQIEAVPIVQSAQCFGSYFVSFLILSVNGCLAFALLYGTKKRLAALTALALFLGNLLLGTVLILTDRDDGRTVTVAAIQGNIENKWDYNALERIKKIYREQTMLAADDGAELIVWPETALPFDLVQTTSIRSYVQEIADQTGAILLIGCFRNETTDDGSTRSYNSLYAVFPNRAEYGVYYDKQKLVPFGEFVPMRRFTSVVFPPLAEIGMLEEDLFRGDPENMINTDLGAVGGMICFDSIYEDVALASVRNGAQLFCLATNDAWFQDSAAMKMHLDQSRLRAIETGRYLLRAGNSGISAVISPTGEILSEIEPSTVGYLLSTVSMRENRTLYSVIGNAFVYFIAAGLLFLCTDALFERVWKRHAHVLPSEVANEL